jgi:hypothetical protein
MHGEVLVRWVDDVFLRWYMVGFFALFGAWTMAARGCLGSVCSMVPAIRGDEAAQDRLHRALVHRTDREGFSKALGVAIGACSFAGAALGATTTIPIALLYAAVTIALALGSFAGYVRLRRISGPRAASLRIRHPWNVVPWYAYAALTSVALLPLLTIARTPVAAVLVGGAALLIVATGWKVATLPALLGGDDLPVERFVDERVRMVRVVSLLGTSTAPVFVFFAIGARHFTPLDAAATTVAFVALIASVSWQLSLMRRPAVPGEIASWSAPSLNV